MLFEAYSELAALLPEDVPHLFGRSLDGTALWLSLDARAYPSILFPMDGSDEQADIALRAIDVEFSRACEIVTDGAQSVAGTYTIVRLNEDEPEIVRPFLRLVEEAFCVDALPADNRVIRERILEIADLFGRVEAAHNDVVGLWGELFVIAKSGATTEAVRCWCLNKNALHDFVAPNFALEVKTTAQGGRTHRFSLEQLRPADTDPVYVASVQLVEAFGGQPVADLIEAIYSQLSEPPLARAFFSLCLIKGGRDIYRSDRRFVPTPGVASPAFFRAGDIKVPAVATGDPVSRVRFDADLGLLTPLGINETQRLLVWRDA